MSQYQASASHSFDVKLATQLGSIELAIVVAHFQYWINKNQVLGRNFIDGRTWMYQTREEIAAHFPYFSSDQVRRYTDKLVKIKILKKGNYNKVSMDKTIWYCFEDEEMFTIGKFANSTGEIANSTGRNAKAIPKSIPKSKTTGYKDLGEETAAFDKNQKKTWDPVRRWNLRESEQEAFHFLKSKGLDCEDSKLAYWAKHHTLQRLIEVYNEAAYYKPDSMRKYMSHLLEGKKVVLNSNIQSNRDFALEYLKNNPWPSAKVNKKYMTYMVGRSKETIDFNSDPAHFAMAFIQKHENNS